MPLGVFAATSAVAKRTTWSAWSRCWLLCRSSGSAWSGLLVFYAKLGWGGGTGRIDVVVLQPTSDLYRPVADSLGARTATGTPFLNAVKHITLPASRPRPALDGLHQPHDAQFHAGRSLWQEYVVTRTREGTLRSATSSGVTLFRNILVQLLTIVALAYGPARRCVLIEPFSPGPASASTSPAAFCSAT